MLSAVRDNVIPFPAKRNGKLRNNLPLSVRGDQFNHIGILAGDKLLVSPNFSEDQITRDTLCIVALNGINVLPRFIERQPRKKIRLFTGSDGENEFDIYNDREIQIVGIVTGVYRSLLSGPKDAAA